MADEPKKDPAQKLRKFGEKLVENAHMVPEGFKAELDKKFAEGARAVEEARRLAIGAAKEASRFHAERLGEFGKALGRRASDVPGEVGAEAKRQVEQRVETVGRIAEDGKTLLDPNVSEDAKFRAGGDLLKRGFDEAAARAGDRAWKSGAGHGVGDRRPPTPSGAGEGFHPRGRGSSIGEAVEERSATAGRGAPRAAAPDGYDDVRARLRAMRERSGPSERLRDKREAKPPGQPLAEGDFWNTLHEHGGDWDAVREAHARDPGKLTQLGQRREEHLEEFAKALREHDGDWDKLRDNLLENDPKRLGKLAATRKEFIDDAMREAGVSREERKAIRGKEQSRKPTSDDDVSARNPEQANEIEKMLVEKLGKAGIEHGDTAKALDCNVYTPFESHRFDPQTQPGHYAEDARRELKHGYVALLRDGGKAGDEAVRARELALVLERKRIQDSVKAGRLAPEEATRRLAGNDLHQAAIGEARTFHGEHLAGKDPAAIAETRRAARQDLARQWPLDKHADPAAVHRFNEQAGLVRALETDSSMSRGGFHSNVSVGQMRHGSHAFDPAEQMTAQLEHMRGYYKAREHDTPQSRQKAAKYLERMTADREAFQQAHPETAVERGRNQAERNAQARATGRPVGADAEEVREGIKRLKAGEAPSRQQEQAIRDMMGNLDRRAVEANPLRGDRSDPDRSKGNRRVTMWTVEPPPGPPPPGGLGAGEKGPPLPTVPPHGEQGEKAPELDSREAVQAAKAKSARLKTEKAEAPSAGKSQSK